MFCSRISFRIRCMRCFFLFRIHDQGQAYGFGCLVNVVRIDQQGVTQFARRTGETTQHQHSVFIVAGCEELFRDKVHSIVQRRNQAQVGCTVVTLNFLVGVLAFAKNDGLPVGGLKPTVNALRLNFNLN